MTQPGYIDYARTSLATGFLLASGSRAFTALTTVFQGYVGSWPYINFFWQALTGPSFDSINLTYFSDSTFTTSVAGTSSTRGTQYTGYRQYAVLSPWLQITVNPSSATDNTPCFYAFYGTTQKASSAKLGNTSVQFLESFPTVGANATVNETILNILPGLASVSVFTKVATAQFDIQRWDFGLAAWQTFWLTTLNAVNTGGTFQVSLPDAPIQAQLTNLTAGAGSLGMWIVPATD